MHFSVLLEESNLFWLKICLFVFHSFFHHHQGFAKQLSSHFAVLTIIIFKWFRGKNAPQDPHKIYFFLCGSVYVCVYTCLCMWAVGVIIAFELTTSPIKLKMSGALLNCLWLGQNWNVWTEIFHSRFMHQTESYSKYSDKIVQLFQRMSLGKVCCFTSVKEHWRTVSCKSWNRTQKLLVKPSPSGSKQQWSQLLGECLLCFPSHTEESAIILLPDQEWWCCRLVI